MVVALVVLGIVTALSLVATVIAIHSAYKANQSNSEIAKQFVSVVMDNGDKIELYQNGKHKATSIQFPNSDGGF